MTADQKKENVSKSQSDLKLKTNKLPKARENAGDQFVIAFSFVFDWLRDA